MSKAESHPSPLSPGFPVTMIMRFMVAALCILGPLTCVAHCGDINGEATYLSFSVPGSLGTYPMSINASMVVTGYYYASPTETRGFLSDVDGTVTTFNVGGAVWTEPESINAAGNITGFYELTAGVAQGFLRYADGRIITFDPLPTAGFAPEAQPVSINDFNHVVGNYPFFARFSVFAWAPSGIYVAGFQVDRLTVATAINASDSVVGYSSDAGADVGPWDHGFVMHPDGYLLDGISAPVPPQSGPECVSQTFFDDINAAGMIAGWYIYPALRCTPAGSGGFVMSPDGVFTLFQPPGTIVAASFAGLAGMDPHWISIDQAGDVTGSYIDAAGGQHGFVRNPYGTISTFDPPEGKQTTATSINDGGVIVGFYHYKGGSGPPVGFIRVP